LQSATLFYCSQNKTIRRTVQNRCFQ